jgi:hypothetical protein
MTQDEIIEMARQAGMDYLQYLSPEAFEKVVVFSKLVAEHEREWVGLTDEEISKIINEEIGFNSCWGPEESFAKAIEAKLKEKNT